MQDNNLLRLKEDLKKLIKLGNYLLLSICFEFKCLDAEMMIEVSKSKRADFKTEYEQWYSEAYQVVKQLLPDRLIDFNILYRNDKRKDINDLTYTISDYILGLAAKRNNEVVCDGRSAVSKFNMQLNILKAAKSRFSTSLFDIRQIVQADLFDSEIDSASELLKNNFFRGAGAVAGVVLEKHLKTVCMNHNITTKKKNPTIADLNDLLKASDVIDVARWRYIQHLGDLRNLCDHDKDREPLKEDVEELIKGIDKITKTVY